jgi:uncharacterized protein YcfL
METSEVVGSLVAAPSVVVASDWLPAAVVVVLSEEEQPANIAAHIVKQRTLAIIFFISSS